MRTGRAAPARRACRRACSGRLRADDPRFESLSRDTGGAERLSQAGKLVPLLTSVKQKLDSAWRNASAWQYVGSARRNTRAPTDAEVGAYAAAARRWSR